MRTRAIVMAALTCALLAPAALQAQREVRVVHRGLLGVLTESSSVDGMQRQVVLDVVPGSPADLAGVRRGDVVLSINGSSATDVAMRTGMAPGDTVVMRVLRDGAERNVSMIVADRSASAAYNLHPVLPDSVMRQIAVIMENVRTEIDTLVFAGNLRLDRVQGENNIVISFGSDSARVLRFGPDSTRVFRFHEPLSGEARQSARFRIIDAPAAMDSVHATMIEALRGRMVQLNLDTIVGVRPAEIFASGMTVGMRAVAGAELSDLNPDLAEYFGVTGGVLVLNAREGTPAARAGMRAGDVIVQVNQTPVQSIAEVRRSIDNASGAAVQLRVLRRGEPIDLSIGRD